MEIPKNTTPKLPSNNETKGSINDLQNGQGAAFIRKDYSQPSSTKGNANTNEGVGKQ